MSMLIAEPRADVNGKIVTRHVKADVASQSSLRVMPAPSLPAAEEAPETVELDDLNIMTSLGVYDINSSACENVESYLEDAYGASFSYDEEEGVETITFERQKDADRFTRDYYNGDLKEDLQEIVLDS